LDSSSTGCQVGQLYSFFAIKSKDEVAVMSVDPGKYGGFESCATTACNAPTAQGVCPNTTAAIILPALA
jgi:hypothetical protein